MKLALQFGYGMKELCKDLIPLMQDPSIILSPRDLSDEQIVAYSKELVALGGKTFIDPQLYAPRSDNERLTNHSYWPQNFSTGLFTDINSLKEIIINLYTLNTNAETSNFILPGIFCQEINDQWKYIQKNVFSAAAEISDSSFATFALSANVIQNIKQIDELIYYIDEECYTSGIYLLAEHPNEDYLVSNPLWLLNLIYLVASLKRLGKYVIVGYTNHQMLCLSLAMADEMASGTWMNVRNFSLSKFFVSDDIKRKNTWYYCPQALTEYTPAFLDIAFQEHILYPFKADKRFSTIDYSNILFSDALPSSTAFGDRLAFRHYLACLNIQCNIVSQGRYLERLAILHNLLDDAQRFLQFAHSYSITGQRRDFDDYVDVVKTAINMFNKKHGALLSRIW